MAPSDALLARTFVELADTLAPSFDVVNFSTTLAERCVELFDADDAGLMLAGADGSLRVVASSSRSMNLLELFELQHNEGPCVDCYRTGLAVTSEDLESDAGTWPAFGPEALDAGYQSADSLPMRLRDTTIGSLNLLRVKSGALPAADLTQAQALADVATIGLLSQRAAEGAHLLADQLQHALSSRVIIEQATGMLSGQSGLALDDAFQALRRYARDHNQRLRDVAQAIVSRSIPAEPRPHDSQGRAEMGRCPIPPD